MIYNLLHYLLIIIYVYSTFVYLLSSGFISSPSILPNSHQIPPHSRTNYQNIIYIQILKRNDKKTPKKRTNLQSLKTMSTEFAKNLIDLILNKYLN